uniref:C-type lectin domain-containing protein n=1 Tax=Branchiostoma floridae TaxID=7739 RepID=C3XPZ8_BRAFL|eukprot:XP_002614010.1 hypothetical protein BRAFLDRAFT_67406 [Branchiostoma floridae]
MAEDNITTDAVPTVHTNGVSEGGLTQIRSDAEIQKDRSYVVTNVFPNPTYETRCSPENDTDSSVPVQDSTTKPELQNTDERPTNASHSGKEVSIEYNENDEGNHMLDTTSAKADAESICQSDTEASKSNSNPTSPQNSGYTKNNDDNGNNETNKDDIYSEIPDEVDITDNDANLDPEMPYAVAYGFPNPSLECNLTERNGDNVVPGNDNNDIHENRHMPSPDPNSIRDALNRNPMYVPNVPQQARRHCTYGRIGFAVIITTLLAALIIFGTWLYFSNNAREVQKTMKADQPAFSTPYTNGHPPENTTSTHGQPTVGTSSTDGQPTTDTTHIPVCPKANYVSFNGVCYKYFAERKTYCDARQACVADGGLLAMPKDCATNTFIPELGGTNEPRWIGLTDANTEGRWVFADGQILESSGYTNWKSGEPNDLSEGGEDCAEVGAYVLFWNDEPCSRSKAFICQLVHTNGASEGGLAQKRSDAEISKDWSYAVTNVFSNPTYETRCSPENDTDSSIPVQDSTTKPERQNADERPTNARHSEKSVSIGYNENDDGNHMLDTTDAKADAESICQSDTEASKSNINQTSPKNSGYTTHNDDNGKDKTTKDNIYAEIPDEDDIIDNDANPDTDLPYAVTYESQNPLYRSECNSTEHDADKGVPGNDKNDIRENRHVSSTDPNSIRDALNRNPMYVPNVPQQAHFDCTYKRIGVVVIITAVLAASIILGIWLYLSNNGREVQKTMKAVDDTTNPYQPALGTPYTNGHHPENTTSTHGHPAVDTPYTSGHTTNIPGRLAGDTTYIPAQSASDTPYTNGHPPENTTSTHGNPTVDTPYTIGHPTRDTSNMPVCPIAAYVNFKGVCYKDFAERKTYCDARQTCAADGALLAMPKDSATSTFIHELGKTTDKRWIGLTKTEGHWVFADDQTLASSAYTNWSPGEPNNLHDGGEDCAEVGARGTVHVWNDEPCTRTKGFVCQLDDDTNLDPSMAYGVAYESPNPLYVSECNSNEHDADNVVPENDNNDIHENRHIPSPDPNSIPDALNRNPMYVRNVPQQARCHILSSSFGQWLVRKSSWIWVSAGAPFVINGVSYDAGKVLDGDTETYWEPAFTRLKVPKKWYIEMDLRTRRTLTRIAVNNYGDIWHDIAAFKLQKSHAWNSSNWEDVVIITDVKARTDHRQDFGCFQGTARYWKFLITRTHWGSWPRLRELNLYAISSFGITKQETSVYMSECNSNEHDADNVVPENDNKGNSTKHNVDNVVPGNDDKDIHKNRHIPSTDPKIRDALNENPMFVPPVPQQARCHCTYGNIGFAVIITALLVALIFFGTWLYFNNNVQQVQKPALGTSYTNGHPAENTTYTIGHPAENTTYTIGHPAENTTYTNGHPAENTTYTIGHPAENTTYTYGHSTVDNPYSNGHLATDTTHKHDSAASATGTWLVRKSSWKLIVSVEFLIPSTGKCDPANAFDGDPRTYWVPCASRGKGYYYIGVNLKAPHTLTRVAVNNYGDTRHDIAAFKLQILSNLIFTRTVLTVTNVKPGTKDRQEFGGFQATAWYWRFLITKTHSHQKPRLTELSFYGIQATSDGWF